MGFPHLGLPQGRISAVEIPVCPVAARHSQMGVSENSVAMRSPKSHELDQTNNHHICSLWMGQRNPPASLGWLKPYEPSGMFTTVFSW